MIVLTSLADSLMDLFLFLVLTPTFNESSCMVLLLSLHLDDPSVDEKYLEIVHFIQLSHCLFQPTNLFSYYKYVTTLSAIFNLLLV